MVYGVSAGDPGVGEGTMAPRQRLGGVESVSNTSGVQSLAGVHEVARELFPAGRRYAWHSLYATELGDDVLETVKGALLSAPTDECELGLWNLGGR